MKWIKLHGLDCFNTPRQNDKQDHMVDKIVPTKQHTNSIGKCEFYGVANIPE